MFNNFYEFHYCGFRKIQIGDITFKEHKIAFSCRFHNRYIVNVEEYENFVYVVKFHLKSHSQSADKYKLRTRFNDANRVVMTCIHVMLFFYNSNPFASFGFIGSNDLGEDESDSRRYNFYKKLMENFFSPVKFLHLEYKKKSAYLLLNRDNMMPGLKKKVEDLFIKLYPNTLS